MRTLLGAGLAIAAMAPAAHAGAWLAPEGGQAIWSVGAGERAGASYQEASAHLELPVSAASALVATPWLEQAGAAGADWRAEAVFGLKRVLVRNGAGAMAVQAGAYWESSPPPGCGEGGLEARWLGGLALGRGRFLNLEAAGRELEGGCSRLRVDLTAGARPAANWLVLGQVFYDAPERGDPTLRFQALGARFTANGRGFQAGLRVRLDGGDPEPALVLGYWARSPG